mgnify:CR=1 FL=1
MALILSSFRYASLFFISVRIDSIILLLILIELNNLWTIAYPFNAGLYWGNFVIISYTLNYTLTKLYPCITAC